MARSRVVTTCAFAVLSGLVLSGCSYQVTADEIPGVYWDRSRASCLRLDSDGSFYAQGVPGSALDSEISDSTLTFSGTWEFLDNSSSVDFVYVSVDDELPERIAGIQLYLEGSDSLYFLSDPDSGPSLTLDRTQSGPDCLAAG